MPEQAGIRQRGGAARSPSPPPKGEVVVPTADKLSAIRAHVLKYATPSRPKAYWHLFVTMALYWGTIASFPLVASYGTAAVAALGVLRGLIVIR
jgi:hypothetical protein